MAENQAPGVFTLQGADGEAYRCQVLEIFDFEGQDYAILFRLEPQDDQGMIVMRLIERDGDSIFQTIDADDEFDRVIAYVHELAEEAHDDN